MPTERKKATVANLVEKMSRMQFAAIADYRGLNVAEITDLRRKIYDSGGDMVIAKNTLIRIAARETGHEAMDPLLEGPTAVTFGYDDVAKVAKALDDYVRSSSKVSVRGGVFGTDLLNETQVADIAKMPSREQVLAQIVSGVQAPVSGVVSVLNAAITNVAYVVQARIDQLQQAES